MIQGCTRYLKLETRGSTDTEKVMIPSLSRTTRNYCSRVFTIVTVRKKCASMFSCAGCSMGFFLRYHIIKTHPFVLVINS